MRDENPEPFAFGRPIQEAVFWRGVFIHRYSGVENTVTELLLRLGGRDDYKAFGELPYPWPKKLKRLSDMLDAPGPLSAYAKRIRGMLTPLTTVERHRHILVHGMMSCDPNKENPRMLLLKTHDRIGGDLGEVTMWLTIDDLIAMTQEMGPWVQAFILLVARIFRELDLRPISVGERQPLTTAPRAI